MGILGKISSYPTYPIAVILKMAMHLEDPERTAFARGEKDQTPPTFPPCEGGRRLSPPCEGGVGGGRAAAHAMHLKTALNRRLSAHGLREKIHSWSITITRSATERSSPTCCISPKTGSLREQSSRSCFKGRAECSAVPVPSRQTWSNGTGVSNTPTSTAVTSSQWRS